VLLIRPLSSANASASAAASERGINRFINDPRDAPFVALTAACTFIVIPFAVALFLPGVFRWWLGLAYLALNFLGFLDRYILMLHNTSHRVLFRPRYRFLNHYIPWVLGPFFGETPETYFSHHVGMHHPENNLEEDLSTTMPFQRDSVLDFLTYYGRFMALAMIDLARYLDRKKRAKLRFRMIAGEASFIVLCVVLAFVNWRATVVVFVAPVLVVRFLMMAGNWGQHAFLDASDPASPYKNSITCLADRYNRRCFNDGYHIGHHVKATRHWTEMPADFEANRATYAREGAVVFKGIDFFAVWALLMVKNYRALARHYHPLDGRERSLDEVAEMLRSRTSPIVREAAVARSVAA
jgi:fatty acid desaturase